jgi:hypothetical protein
MIKFEVDHLQNTKSGESAISPISIICYLHDFCINFFTASNRLKPAYLRKSIHTYIYVYAHMCIYITDILYIYILYKCFLKTCRPNITFQKLT